MLKIVFNEAKTPGVDGSSTLVQHRAERTEVLNLVRLNLISNDVTKAGGAVPA